MAYNLLTNAIKFTPRGGKAGIKAKREGEMVRIDVWDTGIEFLITERVWASTDGFEVIEKLASIPETKSIPIIILTAKILSQEEKSFLKERVYHTTSKSDLKSSNIRKVLMKALRGINH